MQLERFLTDERLTGADREKLVKRRDYHNEQKAKNGPARESMTADPLAPELDIIRAMPDLPAHLLPMDADLRKRWSIVAGYGLISIVMKECAPGVGLHVLIGMIANGEDEFERVTRKQFEGQAFKKEDYNRMFRIVKGYLVKKFGLNEDAITRTPQVGSSGDAVNAFAKGSNPKTKKVTLT